MTEYPILNEWKSTIYFGLPASRSPIFIDCGNSTIVGDIYSFYNPQNGLFEEENDISVILE